MVNKGASTVLKTGRDRLKDRLGRLWDKVAHRRDADENGAGDRVPGLLACIEEAHREWVAARAYFESVEHPDLVDHAVHMLLAAERRYEFLIREAKAEGLYVPDVMAVVNRLPLDAGEGG